MCPSPKFQIIPRMNPSQLPPRAAGHVHPAPDMSARRVTPANQSAPRRRAAPLLQPGHATSASLYSAPAAARGAQAGPARPGPPASPPRSAHASIAGAAACRCHRKLRPLPLPCSATAPPSPPSPAAVAPHHAADLGLRARAIAEHLAGVGAEPFAGAPLSWSGPNLLRLPPRPRTPANFLLRPTSICVPPDLDLKIS